MIFYCQKCNCNHIFTKPAAESLVYALQAALSDVMAGNRDHTNFDTMDNGSNDAFFNFACLNDHATESMDVEAYAEHVTGQIEARKYHQSKEHHV